MSRTIYYLVSCPGYFFRGWLFQQEYAIIMRERWEVKYGSTKVIRDIKCSRKVKM